LRRGGAGLVLVPVAGALAIIWLIGIQAVFIGLLLVVLGARLRWSRVALA